MITDFSDIFQHFITIVFMWSLISICGAFLMIQIQIVQYIYSNFIFSNINFEKVREYFFSVPIQLSHGDSSAVLFVTMIQIAYAFGILLICCEMGQQINLAYDECSQMIDQFDWYLLPYNIQRLLPTIINFAQQSVDIKCFGSTTLDRDTFKYVSLIANSLHFLIYLYVYIYIYLYIYLYSL